MPSFSNKIGAFIGAFRNAPFITRGAFLTVLSTINAAGKSTTLLGKIKLESGSGSKTISAAGGGKIHVFYFSSIASPPVFDNPGTNLRVGIQDVNPSTGLEDGVFDVYCDFTGGTDVIAVDSVVTFPMESGSKTLNHNDLMAISLEFTTRGGSDAITLCGEPNELTAFPYVTSDIGSGPARSTQTSVFLACVEFDDGTIGWVNHLVPGAPRILSLASNSAPDEYAMIFKLPFDGSIEDIVVKLSSISTTDNFDIVVYSDPLGTPQVISTLSYNPFLILSAGSSFCVNTPLADVLNFTANTYYAIAIKPTTTNSIALHTLDFGSGNSKFRRASALGENWSLGYRTDGSGPFILDNEKLPAMGFFVKGLSIWGIDCD